MRIALFTDTYTPGTRFATNGEFMTNGSSPLDTSLDLRLELPGVPLPFYPELVLARPSASAEWSAVERFDPQVVHCATESVIGWSGRREDLVRIFASADIQEVRS